MLHNHTLKKLRENQEALGVWFQSHSPAVARILAAQKKLDWIVLDLEHTPVDLSTSAQIFGSIADVSNNKVTPMARLAAGSMVQVKQALDAGAQGIIVPMINTAEEAKEVVRLSRYPPLGERGAGGLMPHLGFGTTNHIEYVEQANQEILVSVQIETRTSVDNIDEICAVPGLDMIFVGPFDLHISLGLKPTLWSDQAVFLEAMEKIKQACQKNNLPMGTISPNLEGVQARISDGFKFVSLATDLMHLTMSLNTQLETLRS